MSEAFEKRGMGYCFEPPAIGLRFRADYITRRGDDIHAQVLTERRNGSGGWLHVHQGKLLLDGVNAKRDYARTCAEMTPDDEYPWKELVEDLCRRVLRAERQGPEIVKVGRGPAYVPPPPLVDRVVLSKIPTILFGPPGTGKGYLVVYFCACITLGLPAAGLAVRKGKVWYLDWEDSQDIMAKRVQEVCRGMDVEPCEFDWSSMKQKGALHNHVHSISKHVADAGIDLIVVDSVEKAIGAAGEGMNYEDKAKRLFEATDHLAPAAVLFIDHESWQQKNEQTKSVGKAFGSYMKMAWVRAAWQARKEQELGSPHARVALYHAKANHGGALEPLMFSLDFSEQGIVRVGKGDIRDSDELSKPLPLPERLQAVLVRKGPLPVVLLADEAGEDADKVRVALNRGKDRRFLKLDDGRWAALHREGRRLQIVKDEPNEIPF